MSRYAYVNGRYVDHREASVHIEDRGYQFGDGIYEVVHLYDGRFVDEDLHLARLERSLREIPNFHTVKDSSGDFAALQWFELPAACLEPHLTS